MAVPAAILGRILVVSTALVATGCARQLMETPNLYAGGYRDAFRNVPDDLWNTAVEVI